MGLSMRELMTLDIVAHDEASPVVQKVSGTVAASGLAYKQASIRALTYSKVLRGLSRGLTIYGGAALAAAAFSGKAAMDYEHDMGLVRTQTDLSNKAFKNLETGVLNLATKTSRPLSELTQGLYDIFSGINVNGKQGLNMLKSIAKAAQAGNTDIRTATRATLAQLNAFGLGADKVNMILDQQFQLLRYSTGTYEELASAIGNVQPSAVAAGQSLLQVNAGLGFITKAGYSFHEAATRVARAMDYITRPSVSEGMHKFGVEVFTSTGKIRDLSAIVKDFGKKLEPLTEEKRKHVLADIFGAGEARANSFFNLATKGWRQYQTELKQVSKAHGSLDKANQKVAHTTAVLWGKFMNLVRATAITIGNALLPIFNKFLVGVGKLFAWFNKLDPAVKSVAGKFLLWSGIVAILLGRISKLGAGLLSITSMRLWSGAAADAAKATTGLGIAAGATGTKVTTLGKAFVGTLGKFTFWAAIIAGAAYLIIKNWDSIKSWFASFIKWWQDHWRQIWDAIKPILDAVAKGFMKMLQVVGHALAPVVSWIGKVIAKLLLMKPVVQGVVVFLLTMIGIKLVVGIVNALRTIMVSFVRFGAAMLSAARANWVVLLVAALVTAAVLIIKNWAKVKDFFLKLWSSIERGAVTAANWFITHFVNPLIVGIDQVIKAINLINPFKDIPQIGLVNPIKMPAKYVSNLGGAASGAKDAAKATGELGNAAGTASANISGLNSAVAAYGKSTGKASDKSRSMSKEVRALNKVIADQITKIQQGKSGYFSLDDAANNLMSGPWGNGQVTNAARVQAGAIKQAVAVEERHLKVILKTVPQGAGYAHMLAEMGNVSSKAKERTAGLIAVTANLGITFSKAKLHAIALALAGHNLSAVNKILSGAIKGVTSDLKGMPDKKKVKVEADTKGATKGLGDVATKLKGVDKKTVWATINSHDEPLLKKVANDNKKLDAVGKKTVWATINSNDDDLRKDVSNANSSLTKLGSRSVNIPINVSATTDPYAYGYAMGLKVAAGARAALQSHSPSKVFIKIGKDILRGLIIGLEDAMLLKELRGRIGRMVGIIKQLPRMLAGTFKLLKQGTAQSLNAATNGFSKFMDKLDKFKGMISDLRDTINSHIKDIKSKIKDLDKTINDKTTKAAEKAAAVLKKNKLSEQLKQWMDVSGLPNTMGEAAKKLTQWGNDLQRRMTALNNKVQSFVGDFRAGFQQGTDIVGILGSTESRKDINIRKFFRDKITLAKRWSSVMRRLARQGLNTTLLQELAAAGPDALPLAQEILKVGVKYVNRQQGTLNRILGTTQKALVNTVFGDQIDQLAKEAERFHTVLKNLVDIIERVLKRARDNNAPTNPNGNGNGGGGGSSLVYNYHAAPRADTREQLRELNWWWRTQGLGA